MLVDFLLLVKYCILNHFIQNHRYLLLDHLIFRFVVRMYTQADLKYLLYLPMIYFL